MMDWSLIIFVAITLFFIYRGYRRGLLGSVARVLSVVAGYAAAFTFTGQVSQLIEAYTRLQGVLAFVVAGLALFIGAGVAINILFWGIARVLGKEGGISTASALGGAAVGLATGLLVSIIVIWTIGFVRETRVPSGAEVAAMAKPGGIETLANRIAGKAVGSAMSIGDASPEVTRLTAALAKSPGAIVQQAQRLSQSEELTALLHDPGNQAVLNSGDADALRSLPAFQQLMKNPDMQALAESTGLLDEAAKNNQSADAALAERFTDVWGRAQRAKDNPRMQQILADPAFRQKVQSGNPLDLLGDEKLLELTNIIFDSKIEAVGVPTVITPSSSQLPAAGAPSTATPPKSNKKIYTWTDDRGQLHVSDKPPAD